eukprot:sb/3464910/
MHFWSGSYEIYRFLLSHISLLPRGVSRKNVSVCLMSADEFANRLAGAKPIQRALLDVHTLPLVLSCHFIVFPVILSDLYTNLSEGGRLSRHKLTAVHGPIDPCKFTYNTHCAFFRPISPARKQGDMTQHKTSLCDIVVLLNCESLFVLCKITYNTHCAFFRPISPARKQGDMTQHKTSLCDIVVLLNCERLLLFSPCLQWVLYAITPCQVMTKVHTPRGLICGNIAPLAGRVIQIHTGDLFNLETSFRYTISKNMFLCSSFIIIYSSFLMFPSIFSASSAELTSSPTPITMSTCDSTSTLRPPYDDEQHTMTAPNAVNNNPSTTTPPDGDNTVTVTLATNARKPAFPTTSPIQTSPGPSPNHQKVFSPIPIYPGGIRGKIPTSPETRSTTSNHAGHGAGESSYLALSSLMVLSNLLATTNAAARFNLAS